MNTEELKILNIIENNNIVLNNLKNFVNTLDKIYDAIDKKITDELCHLDKFYENINENNLLLNNIVNNLINQK
jgi:hypothetical protein